MRLRSAAPTAAHLTAIGLVAAAILILIATAVISLRGPQSAPVAAPSSPTGQTSIPGDANALAAPSPARSSATSPTAKQPAVSPRDLRALAGRWVWEKNRRIYFVFRADGTGRWVVFGKDIWSGRAQPEGDRTYRLVWDDAAMDNAAKWEIRLAARRLVFVGNNQTYRRA